MAYKGIFNLHSLCEIVPALEDQIFWSKIAEQSMKQTIWWNFINFLILLTADLRFEVNPKIVLTSD